MHEEGGPPKSDSPNKKNQIIMQSNEAVARRQKEDLEELDDVKDLPKVPTVIGKIKNFFGASRSASPRLPESQPVLANKN